MPVDYCYSREFFRSRRSCLSAARLAALFIGTPSLPTYFDVESTNQNGTGNSRSVCRESLASLVQEDSFGKCLDELFGSHQLPDGFVDGVSIPPRPGNGDIKVALVGAVLVRKQQHVVGRREFHQRANDPKGVQQGRLDRPVCPAPHRFAADAQVDPCRARKDQGRSRSADQWDVGDSGPRSVGAGCCLCPVSDVVSRACRGIQATP